MVTEDFLRKSLWATTVFNAGAALLFFFPHIAAQFVPMPPAAPPFQSVMLGCFVLLFGGSYAWNAVQPVIDRPLLALGAIGKAVVFVLALCFWLAQQIPFSMVLAASGDLAFAAIFTAWLRGEGAVSGRG